MNDPANSRGIIQDFDPLIDEIREIRREICAEFDHDLDRLCDHLREVEAEYRSGTGRFSGLMGGSSESVIAGWGNEVYDLSDPLIDEIKTIRRDLSESGKPMSNVEES